MFNKTEGEDMQKVLVSASHFDTLCQDAWKLFEEHHLEVIYDPGKEFPAYSTEEIRAMGDREEFAAALIGMDDYRDEEKYRLLPNLKAVAKFGVGVDNVDIAMAKRHGVRVLNAPGQNSNAVAELTVGFIIAVLRHIVPLHEKMTEGKWPRVMGNEMKGKTVGLVGFGAIARLVAEKLRGFDVQILAFDLYPDRKEAERLGVEMTTLDHVVKESDVISLHVPATKDNVHQFNSDMFAKMKDGAYLINAARGALVDLDDLAEAIQSGKIAGAALDAFETEPLPLDSPILACSNIVLTPHTGAETVESYYNVSMTTAKDIIAVLEGRKPVHAVG